MTVDFKKLKDRDARLITVSYNPPLLIYHFMIGSRLAEARIKAVRNADSITHVFPNAGFYEREIWEKHGLVFKNHPRLERLFTEQ